MTRPLPQSSASPASAEERSSRIPGFYKLSRNARLLELEQRAFIDEADIAYLGRHDEATLETAECMVENVIGVLELPLGLALNFVVNGRDYAVPLAVEEPSIIAAVSHAAKIVRGAGGFRARCESSTMIGQIQVIGVADLQEASSRVMAESEEILRAANAIEPSMLARGGGAVDIEVRVLDDGPYRSMLVVHLLVDTCDAMGANLINTMVEGVAPMIERLTEGQVFLRILSNLADRRTASASCRIPFEALKWREHRGDEVARGIVIASEFAESDPYRAATHNKGIMNGISAACVATGNDWRAIEAGAHAFAARDGAYGPMATWRIDDGHLVGELEVPMALGTVGGPIRLHRTVQIAHKILDVAGAQELAQVFAAVGLAQNMAALKALSTEGIQAGHMSLHARCVAATAGARETELDDLVTRLIRDGDIKVEQARRLLLQMRTALLESGPE